eukprot:2958803-Rhodomonas_salina.3
MLLQDAVSWYKVDDSVADLTFERDAFYGWRAGSTVWDQYLLSLYWVSATLTVNGLVGEVIPQNLYEVGFTIVLMLLNMTVYRWIIGEVSARYSPTRMPSYCPRHILPDAYAELPPYAYADILPYAYARAFLFLLGGGAMRTALGGMRYGVVCYARARRSPVLSYRPQVSSIIMSAEMPKVRLREDYARYAPMVAAMVSSTVSAYARATDAYYVPTRVLRVSGTGGESRIYLPMRVLCDVRC